MTHASELGLRAGAAALGVELAEAQVGQLLAYADLLQKWGRVYNLTALRDPAETLTHHLLDSLAAVPPIRRHAAGRPLSVLDVGSGAGLPGVVLAITCPDFRVDCVDAVAKKAAFIQQCAAALQLKNLRGLHARVEQLEQTYDVVTSRAFASLQDFVRLSSDLVGEGGVWIALKGRSPDAEIALLPPEVVMFHVEPLQVPGLGAERCLVWMRRA